MVFYIRFNLSGSGGRHFSLILNEIAISAIVCVVFGVMSLQMIFLFSDSFPVSFHFYLAFMTTSL